MSPELSLLVISAASIAFVHTLLGPDHYLPFVALAKARNWSRAKTLRVTLWCGLGHLLGSIVLGLVGILVGAQLASLSWVEAVRGDLAAWLLVGFGLAYATWGLRQAWRNRPHSHWHHHGEMLHRHVHTHHADHAHVHDQGKVSITPWIVFVIFVLGPCEPLIPLLMYPAALESMTGVLLVTGVFGVITVATMTAAVMVALTGLRSIRLRGLERYAHAFAGAAILVCGLSIVFLGV